MAAARDRIGPLVPVRDGGFPADRAAVVGRGLTPTARVTGRLSSMDVCARGALSGVIVGFLAARLLTVFDVVTPAVSSFWPAVGGAILGRFSVPPSPCSGTG
jgi:hypothetical protein